MKVSIIIPVYNTEKHLRRCVESVLNQTYQDLEVLLIDDGSIDSSGDICDEYAHNDKRVKCIHSINQGVAHARNLGLDNATGEYIVFVDSDDYVLSRYVENLIDGVLKNNSDVSISMFKRISENQIETEKSENGNTVTWQKDQAIINMMLARGTDSCVCCKLFNRLIFSNERFNEELSVAEDMEFFYRIFSSANRICFSSTVDYMYVQYAGSSINSLSEDKINSLSIFESLLKTEQNELVRNAICSKYISTCFHFLTIAGKKNDTKKVLIDIIKEYRHRIIWKRTIALKVRIALFLSFISFNFVIKLKTGR